MSDDKKCGCGEIQACDVCLETRRLEIDAPAPAGGKEADKFVDSLRCINVGCDNSGCIVDANYYTGEPEQQQCEFCHRYRFPAIEAHENSIAATEARVRAEVWGKAHEAVDKSSARVTEMVRTGNVLTVSFDQLPDAQVLVFVDAEAIEKAALADGADLTSLAKPE